MIAPRPSASRLYQRAARQARAIRLRRDKRRAVRTLVRHLREIVKASPHHKPASASGDILSPYLVGRVSVNLLGSPSGPEGRQTA